MFQLEGRKKNENPLTNPSHNRVREVLIMSNSGMLTSSYLELVGWISMYSC